MGSLSFLVITLCLGLCMSSNPCIERSYGEDSIVCVCNSTYCDTYDHVGTPEAGSTLLITTSKQGKRMHVQKDQHQHRLADAVTLTVDRSVTYQKIIGFGAAFTDSAGINLHKLSEATQQQLLKSYYSDEGLEYSTGRVPIGGTDFSTRPYTYVDQPGDTELQSFALAEEDLQQKIPVVKQALEMRKSIGDGEQLKLFASPWSAPAWMKTNNEIHHGGFLLRKYQSVWAEYFLRFLQEYDKHGVNFWALTIQNEPTAGFVPFYKWNSMGWLPWGEGSFVRDHLGPMLEKSKFGDTVLISMDDQRFSLPLWSWGLFSNPSKAQWYKGIGVHWYHDKHFGPRLLDNFHEKHPDVFILYTEACEENKPALGKWELAERYAHNILEDLTHHVSGWTDWNFALDRNGGPNWANNFVDSPIIVNEESDEFYKQPSYYALGHFSKYIPRGSHRVGMSSDSKTQLSYGAFVAPSGSTVTIVLNFEEQEQTVNIIDGDSNKSFTIEPSSINTIIW